MTTPSLPMPSPILTTTQLCAALEAAGVTIAVRHHERDRSRYVVASPKSAVDATMAAALRRFKAEIVGVLGARNGPTELVACWVCQLDFAELGSDRCRWCANVDAERRARVSTKEDVPHRENLSPTVPNAVTPPSGDSWGQFTPSLENSLRVCVRENYRNGVPTVPNCPHGPGTEATLELPLASSRTSATTSIGVDPDTDASGATRDTTAAAEVA